MQAKPGIAGSKLLMCRSPTDRRAEARLEASTSRSIADVPVRVLYAADVGRPEDGSSHRGKASCVGRGGLPDDQTPKRAGARLSLFASFAKAMLAALCVRPKLLHIADNVCRSTSSAIGRIPKPTAYLISRTRWKPTPPESPGRMRPQPSNAVGITSATSSRIGAPQSVSMTMSAIIPGPTGNGSRNAPTRSSGHPLSQRSRP